MLDHTSLFVLDLINPIICSDLPPSTVQSCFSYISLLTLRLSYRYLVLSGLILTMLAVALLIHVTMRCKSVLLVLVHVLSVLSRLLADVGSVFLVGVVVGLDSVEVVADKIFAVLAGALVVAVSVAVDVAGGWKSSVCVCPYRIPPSP